jgi:hypothetical protein
MADEIKPFAVLRYEDDEGADIALGIADGVTFDITTKKFEWVKHNVGTAEEAMKLGELSALGWCIFINRDDTNYVEIRSGTGASNDIIKVPAGGVALFHWGSDVSAPYVIAPTAACQCEYLILST